MKPRPLKQQKQCYFCANDLKEVDYKDAHLLRRFLSSYLKILPKKRTGMCSSHQRKLAASIKRARILALIPFTHQ